MGTRADRPATPGAETDGVATAAPPDAAPATTRTASPITIRRDIALVASVLAVTPAMLTTVNAAMSASAMIVVADNVSVSGPTPSVQAAVPARTGIVAVRCTANPTAAAAIAPEKP